MAVTQEIRDVIKETVEESLQAFAEKQTLVLQLHEANCPGRRVGKVFLVAAVALAGTAGAGAAPVIKAIIQAISGQ